MEEVLVQIEQAGSNLDQAAATLQALSGGIGFQTLHWIGNTSDQKIMITDKLGPSLEDAFERSNRFFDMPLVLEIASQLIFRLEWMHSHNVFHGRLTPSSFSLGPSAWQTPQVILASFETIDTSENAVKNDLEAVADILIYLATGPPSWEHFQRSKPKLADIPAPLRGFLLILSNKEINPADYLVPRAYFRAARQSLPGRTILGGLGGPQDRNISLKFFASKQKMELFDMLGSKIAAAGSSLSGLSWGNDQAEYVLESLNEIMTIYIVLLLRDKPTLKRRNYLRGTHHLPNRL